jgi:hypothetical protein
VNWAVHFGKPMNTARDDHSSSPRRSVVASAASHEPWPKVQHHSPSVQIVHSGWRPDSAIQSVYQSIRSTRTLKRGASHECVNELWQDAAASSYYSQPLDELNKLTALTNTSVWLIIKPTELLPPRSTRSDTFPRVLRDLIDDAFCRWA